MEGSEAIKDARSMIEVQVSDDGMTAYIKMEELEDSVESISLPLLTEALQREKVVYGISESALEKLVQRPIYRLRIQVAKGLEPVDGTDGKSSIMSKRMQITIRTTRKKAQWITRT